MNIQKDNKVGKYFWFEYHCYESPESCDAEIWYRSHQKVKVLSVSEWSFDSLQDRINDGQPRVYLVEWEDGFQYDVYEDELFESPNEFYRSSPPIKNLQESIRRILREGMFVPPSKKKIIDYVDEYMEDLNSDYVCNHWVIDEVDRYVEITMTDIVTTIMENSSEEVIGDNYTSKYDEIYESLINLNYPEQLRDFFYESIDNCDDVTEY